MKLFNLAIASVALAAAVSTSAFAANVDINGNIPDHHNDQVTGYSDSFNAGTDTSGYFVDHSVRPGAGVSARDEDVLRLRLEGDQGNGGR